MYAKRNAKNFICAQHADVYGQVKELPNSMVVKPDQRGTCWDRCSNNPIGQLKSTCCITSWPVAYKAGLLLIIRKITLCSVYGLPHWATGYLVRQRVGQLVNPRDLEKASLLLGWHRLDFDSLISGIDTISIPESLESILIDGP
jgi:hypothetical protein